MLLNSLQCTGHPHYKELSGPNVNSAKGKKPWPNLILALPVLLRRRLNIDLPVGPKSLVLCSRQSIFQVSTLRFLSFLS